jgi:outer membrane protein assembly factor BamB
VASGTPRWTTQLPSRLRHPAVALGDAVVVASAAGLVGLDRTTGEVVWTRRPAYPPGWLATVDDVIVVESGPALVGLDDDHGGERWRTRLPAVPAEEAAGDGVVYLAVNRTLIAIETRGGRVQWRVPLYGQWPVTAPVASAEGLFVGIDGEVVALS